MSSNQEWLAWIEVQKHTAKAVSSRDLAGAKAAIEAYLSGSPPADLQSEALAFRADLFEQEGDFGKARDDFRAALTLVESGYQKYALELVLGSIYEEALGDSQRLVGGISVRSRQPLLTVRRQLAPRSSGCSPCGRRTS